MSVSSVSSSRLGLQRALCIIVLLIVVLSVGYAIYIGISSYSRISV